MELIFLSLILIVAYLYSSVGHGGASGYLALMVFFGMEPAVMRSSALTLNLFVAGIAFIVYMRGGHFRYKKVMPFLLTSIPFAAIGATLRIHPDIYKAILGVFLMIAVARILIRFPDFESEKDPPLLPAFILGAVLGFFSGMIGIGGGIILTPLLLLFRWANVKEAAAASAIFIFLNSASGLISIRLSGESADPSILAWIVAGLLGGFLGSYSGSYRFSLKTLKYILAGVLILASIKLFLV